MSRSASGVAPSDSRRRGEDTLLWVIGVAFVVVTAKLALLLAFVCWLYVEFRRVIPLLLAWLAMNAIWACALAIVWTRRRRSQRARAGLCVRCAYDLTGNTSGVCPECGTPVVRPGLRK